MGTSFVRFRSQGFWANDLDIEVWLSMASREIDSIPTPPEWLMSLAAEWRIQATSGFNGFIDALLDEFLITDDLVMHLVSICNSVLYMLGGSHETISPDTLESWRVGGESAQFLSAYPVKRAIDFGEKFISLLNGYKTEV